MRSKVAILGVPGAEVTVYARFPLPRVTPSRLLQAYLLVAPASASSASSARAVVLSARGLWDEHSISWRLPPRLVAPAAGALLGPSAFRFPVTRLPVRALVDDSLRRGDADLALALRAADVEHGEAAVRLAPEGALPGIAAEREDASQQSSASQGPQLEIYLR